MGKMFRVQCVQDGSRAYDCSSYGNAWAKPYINCSHTHVGVLGRRGLISHDIVSQFIGADKTVEWPVMTCEPTSKGQLA